MHAALVGKTRDGLRPDRGNPRPDERSHQEPGAPSVYEAADVSRMISTADHPRYVTYAKDGVTHRIDCDFIAGCDGFHGVSRASVPAKRPIQAFERDLSVRLARRSARTSRRWATN